MATIRVLFLGDIVGAAGLAIFQKHIGRLREQYHADAVIVNGENSASGGRGITPAVMRLFKEHGVAVVTSGNHIWHKPDIVSYFAHHTNLLRPLNFPAGTPGAGMTSFICNGFEIGVINVQGRVFMRELLSCPFRAIESALTYLQHKTRIIFIDVHAEATSEKMGVAYLFDGRVSGVVGTHTHVQTADERILPGGTAYITDLGMAGSLNSMIGMKREPIIQNFLTQMPTRFAADTSLPLFMTGVCIGVDTQTGKATSIERIRIVDDAVSVDTQEL